MTEHKKGKSCRGTIFTIQWHHFILHFCVARQHIDEQRGTFKGTLISQLPTVKFKSMWQNGCLHYLPVIDAELHSDWEIFSKDPQQLYRYWDNEFSHNMDRIIRKYLSLWACPLNLCARSSGRTGDGTSIKVLLISTWNIEGKPDFCSTIVTPNPNLGFTCGAYRMYSPPIDVFPFYVYND